MNILQARLARTITAVALICLTGIAVPAQGAVIIDDTFDDGVLETNTTGVGTGFTKSVFGVDGAVVGASDVTETGGSAVHLAVDTGTVSGSQNIAEILSKDMALADGITATYYVSGDGNNPGNKVRFELSGTDGTDTFRLNLSLFGSDGTYPNKARVRAGDTANFVIGTDLVGSDPNWAGNHGLDWTDDYVVTLSITSTGYSVSLSDGAGPSSDPTWTGLWGVGSASAITFHDIPMQAASRAQSNRHGSVNLVLDRVVVTGTAVETIVPEPATMGFLALGAVAVLVRARRRGGVHQ